jgi:hypothetical protein
MIVNIRTKNDLVVLLAAGQSGNWTVAPVKEANITKVRIFNWPGDSVLIADFDPNRTHRDNRGKLIIGIVNGTIHPCAQDWFRVYGQASVIYSQNIAVQILGGIRIGVVRSLAINNPSNAEIKEYFKNLIKEIKLLGINRIVFRAGGTIPLPDFFRDWCLQNGVAIEILEDDDLGNNYPTNNDITPDDLL